MGALRVPYQAAKKDGQRIALAEITRSWAKGKRTVAIFTAVSIPRAWGLARDGLLVPRKSCGFKFSRRSTLEYDG
jgi:hypothetical protein